MMRQLQLLSWERAWAWGGRGGVIVGDDGTLEARSDAGGQEPLFFFWYGLWTCAWRLLVWRLGQWYARGSDFAISAVLEWRPGGAVAHCAFAQQRLAVPVVTGL